MSPRKKYIHFAAGSGLTLILLAMVLVLKVNGVYARDSRWSIARENLSKTVFIASPAIVPAGRNIAFETGNAVSNAPASYLTMLSCCESDEAIADRIAVGQTQCRIIRRRPE